MSAESRNWLEIDGRALVVEDVSKRFEDAGLQIGALSAVSLSVRPGQIVAMLGRNGAGKSTLLSVMAGVLTADSGWISVCGQQARADSPRAPKRLGFAPQEEAVYPLLTVRENLEYFGRLVGLRRQQLLARVDAVAGGLQLSSALDRKCSTLSGGKRRRVHIGLSLMHEPEVLLLDEPTVGVDIGARFDFIQFVRSLAQEGLAVVYSTHHLAEVEALEADLLVMDSGRAIFEGSTAQLIADFAPPLVKLEFSGPSVDLPLDLVGALDEQCRTDSGGLRVEARLADSDVAVADVIGVLGESARAALTAASIVAPSLDSAYRRLLRVRGADEADRVFSAA